MKRIILTESQFSKLLDNELDTRISSEILEEGPKEWLLTGLLTLASLAGISQTKKEVSYDKTKIEAAKILQDKLYDGDEKAYSLLDSSEIELNQENLNKLLSVDLDDVSMGVINTGSRSIAKSKLKQGYVLSDIKITSDTILKKGDVVYMGDTITLDFDSDVAFRTATFNLTETYRQELLNKINEISEINGKITKVTVESSTDTEPIKMGNQKLAELRSNSVVDILNTMGLGNVEVINLPDQGPNVYSRTMSNQEREQARQETAQYRYVMITIEYEVEVVVPSEQTVEEVINKYKFEMVKVTPKQDIGTYKFKGKSVEHKPLKQPKCKKVRHNTKMTACPADLMN